MAKKQSFYKSIFRATAITGSAQIGQIVARLLSSKFLAVILGPSGTGLIGLIQSTLQVVTSLFGLGLSFSAVRNIAEANGKGNQAYLSKIYTIAKYWLYVTGIIGAAFTLIFAPYLSEITFGNEGYANLFKILSIYILIGQINIGQLTLLQGLRKIREMAIAKVTGAFIGLLITIPIYYFYGIDGIAVVFILLAISNLSRSWYFTRKIKLPRPKIKIQEFFSEGKSLLSLGVVGLVNSLSITLSGYLIRTLIQQKSGTEAVGIYQAAWAIGVGYVQLVFSAMSADYYPRLTELMSKWQVINELKESQTNIALWISTPLLIFLAGFSNIVIYVLYTNQYAPAAKVISLIMIGVVLKIFVWPIGFLLPVFKKNAYFIGIELIWHVIFLSSVFLIWNNLNLISVGIAYIIAYAIYGILLCILVARLFEHFEISKMNLIEFLKSLLLVSLSTLIFFQASFLVKLISISLILILATINSFVHLKPILSEFRK